ncbi:MAG: fatty acyl-AMP ligase [Deltaproteobacteria bacterium]|nr:MAG: fatty acyl-AMP ligase [Deltaproteobacteria bacterium]
MPEQLRRRPTIPRRAVLPDPRLPATLFDSLARAARLSSHRVGLRFLDRRERATTLPWARVYDRALRSGDALRRQGIRPGDRVAIIVPTDPLFVDAFFGALAAGAVPVPMGPPLRLGRLDEYHAVSAAMLDAVEPAAIIADSRNRRLLGGTVQRWAPPLGVLAAETLARGNPARSPEPGRPEAIALVQFSAGTTAVPKPVALTHAQVLANVDAILDHVPVDATDDHGAPLVPGCVSWLPLHRNLGLIGCLFTALRRPASLTLMPPESFLQRPVRWLRAISRARATMSAVPDFAYALCVERIPDSELDGLDLSCWRLALSGSGPISPGVLRRFHARFGRAGLSPLALTPVYGLSEAALAVTCGDPNRAFNSRRFDRGALARGRAVEVRTPLGVGQPPPTQDPHAIELVSVGRPLRAFGVEIRSDDGTPLPAGHVGRVWATGPSLMQGYLDRDIQPIHDGWLDTGDLGFIHEGDLYVHGRATDQIHLDGAAHAPHHIESAVDEVAGVRAGCAAAVGEPADGGERLVLFVEYREERAELAEACRQAVIENTGLDPALVVLLAPGTLPRSGSGRIRRREALRRWQAGELTEPDAVTPLFLAGAMARSAWGYLRARRARQDGD